ncbi:MAG: glycosyltransferase family 39 protein [Hyphomicrobiaceae bacterium]|nr:glycosyltransferase family 39 protein [Hyphomicrobiaceae bacterium]
MKLDQGINAGRSQARWIAALLLGLAALLGLRLILLGLNRTDLFFDEAQYWSWSLEPDFGYYSKPPLIAWLIRAATDVCGHGEACIRTPAPIIHTLTALVVFLIGKRLFGTVTGVLSALAFATLPGVSVSSGIISTDVPLLFFWALALLALILMREQAGLWPALLLGFALGAGLNAKYAMVWFVLCLGVYLIATPRERGILKDWRLWFAFAIAAAMLAPNIAWNQAHKFATLSHTADNANWQGSLLHPGKALEFFAAQFGVFGPVLFAGLLMIGWRAWKEGVPEADRLLLAFSVPVIVVITIQAFLSRAHANWAAVSYVAATVLVIATMIRDVDWKWLRRSMLLHVALLLALIPATVFAGRYVLPSGVDPFSRTLGWREVADATRQELAAARAAGHPFAAVLTEDRSVTAELIYYMRDEPTPVLAWRAGPRPTDHYELTRPYTSAVASPVLLVSLSRADRQLMARFDKARLVNERKLPAGRGKPRTVIYTALEGFKEK